MFDTLLSNKNMIDQLCRAIDEDRPLHAYLFCGAKGTGKKTAALLFAAELVGNGRDKALRGTHPDIIFVRPEDGKKNISVEAVRNMRADAFITPTEGRRKVYIVDGPLGDEGQNALLTVLEQPPSFSVFILLAESRQKILETVISRCSVFDMEYVEPKDGAAVLKEKLPSLTESECMTYMRAASGNIGYAIQLASDETYNKNLEVCKTVAAAMAKSDRYTVTRAILSFKKKDTLSAFLQVLSVFLRDIAVYNSTGNRDMLVFSEDILKNGALFGKMDIGRLYNCINECATATVQLESGISHLLISCDVAAQLCGGKTV